MTASVKGLAAAAGDIRLAAAAAETLAWNEGVDRDGSLGAIVHAQAVALHALADFGEKIVSEVKGSEVVIGETIGRINHLGETELAKAKELVKSGEAALKSAAEAKEEIKAQYDESFTRQVESIGRRMITEMKPWLVLKQTQHNRNERWVHLLIGLVAGIGILSVGYGIRSWQDEPATTALARCAAAPMQVQIAGKSTGEPACKLDQLLPRQLKDGPSAVAKWLRELWPISP
ncbi:MAG: hypothetical protein ACLPSF_05245 [Methylocella sp.]